MPLKGLLLLANVTVVPIHTLKDDGDDATRLREIRDDIVSLLAFYSFYSVKAFSRGRKRNGRKRLPRHGWLQPSPAAVFSFQLGIVSFFAPFVNA